MLIAILVYAAIALIALYKALRAGPQSFDGGPLVDIINRIGQERERHAGWLALQRTRLDRVLSIACDALAWPVTMLTAVLVLRYRDARRQFRVQALLRLHAPLRLLQPLVVLVLLTLALALHTQVDPPDALTCTITVGGVLYATLYQLKLLVSPQQIKTELKRSLWDPRLKAAAVALIQLATLAVAYAALAGGALTWSSVMAVARTLALQRHLLSGVLNGTSGSPWQIAVALSGALLAVAILRTAIKFWTLARGDDDWIDLSSTQLLAARFKDALRGLEHVRNPSAESELHRGVALLATGDLDGAVRHARHFWSLNSEDEVTPSDAAARLLGGATLFLVPWAQVKGLLERCLADEPRDARVYACLNALLQSEPAPGPKLESVLRDYAAKGTGHSLLLAYALFGMQRYREALDIAASAQPGDAVGRAVASHLRIVAATYQCTESRDVARKAFDRVCRQHLPSLEAACAECRSVDDLQFLLVLTHEIDALARQLVAEARFHAAAVFSQLQERHRLIAPARRFDDYELVRRGVLPHQP